jgi:hypothetical protein
MASILRSTREISNNTGYYIPLADIRTKMLSYNEATAQFSTATWAIVPSAGAGPYSTLVASSGAGLLKDLGRTIVSSSRTFRKVQVVVSSISTGGVAGAVGSTYPQMDFLTAYIELGFDGAGAFTPVAQYGR